MKRAGILRVCIPFRSKHVVERLHEFLPIDDTAIFRYENGGQSGPADTVFPSTGVYPEQRDIFSAMRSRAYGMKKTFSNYTSAIQGLFFRECDAVFPFQSGYV